MDTRPPEGRKFYGSVTVSERGQIVVPAEARKDFNIKPGDKLLVFGDIKTGMWLTTFAMLEDQFKGMTEFFRNVEAAGKERPAPGPEEK